MKFSEIKSCYIGPEVSPEQFIPEHFFLFLAKGKMDYFDGSKHYTLHPGEYCIVRKNNLARYNKQKENNYFEKVIILFDETFLRSFEEKHSVIFNEFESKNAVFKLDKNFFIDNFIQSLQPYFEISGRINDSFSDLKREELLLILLKQNPELSGIFFDFNAPGKINLQEFMQKNYKFNVSIDRFAYLTGRSLSSFKKDFKEIFNDTPSHWLVKRRLEEAHFLMKEKLKKPNDIYIDLGFEDLSHFSFAFKKQFGFSPSEVR
ncbi:hypothetical protein GCM10023210_10100 [Chryseobacterium ginsengisoli]|uniref:HTH araC/xylS-type domain-containing protein n=1 Tax=Chryseobacterium ginsengisoli TaxID=363853 RepID=A0ABP9M049_9FLAO